MNNYAASPFIEHGFLTSRVPRRYSSLRATMSEHFAEASNATVEKVAQRAFGAEAAVELEDWLSTLAQIGQAVLPLLAGAAGTMIGGPVGAAAGTALGTAGAGAIGAAARDRDQSHKKKERRKKTGQRLKGKRAPSTTARSPQEPAPTTAPGTPTAAPAHTGNAPAPGSTVNPQAAALLGLLSRPEVMQALTAMAFGQAGASHVDVGDTPVPVEAVAGLLGMLSDQALVRHAELSVSASSALVDDEGHSLVADSSPETANHALLQLFVEACEADTMEDDLPPNLDLSDLWPLAVNADDWEEWT